MEIIYVTKVIWDLYVKSVIFRLSYGIGTGLKLEDIVALIVLK